VCARDGRGNLEKRLGRIQRDRGSREGGIERANFAQRSFYDRVDRSGPDIGPHEREHRHA
jgi:hypothetical protein